MGDISAEPSMEEILSSIKRIIAEESEPGQSRPRRPGPSADVAREHTPAAPPPPTVRAEEVLELSDPIRQPPPPTQTAAPTPIAVATTPAPTPAPTPVPTQRVDAPAATEPAETAAEPIVSRQAAAASRGSLEALSKMLVKPEPDSDGTLEGLVREMLRPMLRDWLDANLPTLVETMVAREIEKITAQPK
ncbi:DUF2497 domain-containing protein [uncultured Sphingomonas sp.]|uniref:DUF2497 domain-containing protein n=1 Tax=uncultured Sphingomonas sp. TaxID=158754 RepID=UPI0035CC3E7F